MPDLNSFIKKYENLLQPKSLANGSFSCFCPAHEDDNASLIIAQGDVPDGNGGTKIIMKCMAGCETRKILKELGAFWSEINGGADRSEIRKEITKHYGSEALGECTQLYDFTDRNGTYLYSKARFLRSDGNKALRFCQIDYSSGKVLSFTRGCDPVLYRLPELLGSISSNYPVYMTEGEKDVHTLLDRMHYTATTAGSASDWKKEYAAFFRGASVVIFPDNDKAGKNAVNRMQRDLLKTAFRVKVVYTSRKEKGDVTDYFEEGHTEEELKELIDASEWNYAEWVNVKNGRATVNTDLLAAAIDQNENYLIVRQPAEEKDILYSYDHGVYVRVNKNQFISQIIRPYIPQGVGSVNQMENTMKLLLTRGTHSASLEDLNNNDDYINLKNGLLNIETWKLEAHRPDLLSTIQLNVEYQKDARGKDSFDKFMADFVRNPDGSTDAKKAKIIQEFFGLVFSNKSVRLVKKALFLVSRTGNTGKSTLLNLIIHMLGTDHVVPRQLQELDNGNGNRFMLGGIRGARLITCGDQSSVTIRDGSTLKQLTTGDRLRSESKGRQAESIVYRGFIAVAGNQLPFFADDQGDHVMERMLVIPLYHSVLKKDTKLLDKMIEEESAIFNWFMAGLKRVMRNGYVLTESKDSLDFMEEYKESGDSVYRYLKECYERTDDINDKVAVIDFYSGYLDWCRDKNAGVTYGERLYVVSRKKDVKARVCSRNINCTIVRRLGCRQNISCYLGLKKKGQDK